MDGSDHWWREAIAGGADGGSDRRRRGGIAGARGGGLSQALLGGTGPGTVSRLCIVAMLAGPGPASLLGYDRLFQAVSHPSLSYCPQEEERLQAAVGQRLEHLQVEGRLR